MLILDTAYLTLPAVYPTDEADCLVPYRRAEEVEDPVRALADQVAGAAAGDPLDFLKILTQRLHREIQREIRHQGSPRPPPRPWHGAGVPAGTRRCASSPPAAPQASRHAS